jgi:hypothetical protein
MTTAELERRLRSLELEVAELKRQMKPPSSRKKDLRRVAGLFAGDKDFGKMVRFGKEYRKRS